METTKDESLVLSFDWPRSVIAAPETFNGRMLNQAEHAFWTKLEEQFAPFVIGDEIGDTGEYQLPTPLSIGWSSLYSLAIYFMTALVKRIHITPDMSRPQGLEWAQWDQLLTEFWKRRNYQLQEFRKFLNDWELSKSLGTPTDHFGMHGEVRYENPYADDRKVLGLHRFQAWNEVADYALRWGRNPLIRDTHLWQHRFTVSRGIDLICSELLSNGFEHGGAKNADVFIMAKLCSHNSAWRALDLDKQTPYLTQTEKHFFDLAVKHKCSILQLCIGDRGQGFGGNRALQKKYVETIRNSKSTLDEVKLISFALSGKVSTKTREHHHSYWKKQVAGDADVIPTIHGLAEVRRYVRKMHGYWRIHSNTVTFDHDFLNQPPNNNDAFPFVSKMDARPVPGCLHYFMFPLLPEETLPTISHLSRRAGDQRFVLIDSADDALRQNHGQFQVAKIDQWVGSFCDRIAKAQETQVCAVLLHLGIFDQLNKQDLEDACLDLARCLHRVRDDLAVFLSGASEKTRSQVFRYYASPAFDLEYRILPFLDFQPSPKNEIILQLRSSDTIRDVQEDLTRILTGNGQDDILKSDNVTRWELFRRVHAENQGLFNILPVSSAGDESFRARVQLSFHDQKTMALLCGGISFSEFANYLLRHEGIAPTLEGGYFCLGKQLPTYVHVERLWADADFQLKVTNWLRISFIRAQAVLSGVSNDGRGLILFAVLHPAIELAHELIRFPQFANAEIVEIRRVSELRWDFEPLLKVRGRKVAVLIDMVSTGETVRRIVDIINYIGLEAWACFSVLSIENCVLGIPEHAFCQCTGSELQHLAKNNWKGSSK